MQKYGLLLKTNAEWCWYIIIDIAQFQLIFIKLIWFVFNIYEERHAYM